MAAAILRAAGPEDTAAIRCVVSDAFGRRDEAVLVARLRHEGVVVPELLAEEGGEIVGHVLFSAAPISEGEHRVAAAALAPLSVRSDHQHKGVGSALVTAGLKLCRARGIAAVLVLGDPDFYGRFGFDPDLVERLRSPFSGAAFQAVELVPGALARGGAVRYPDAFLG